MCNLIAVFVLCSGCDPVAIEPGCHWRFTTPVVLAGDLNTPEEPDPKTPVCVGPHQENAGSFLIDAGSFTFGFLPYPYPSAGARVPASVDNFQFDRPGEPHCSGWDGWVDVVSVDPSAWRVQVRASCTSTLFDVVGEVWGNTRDQARH